MRTPRKSSVGRYKSSASPFFSKLFKILLIIAIVLLMIFLGFIGYNKLTKEAYLPINTLFLDRPLIYADANDIRTVLAAQDSLDFVNLNINKLANDLDKLSWIEYVSVSREWPDKLRISILERIPYLRWNKEDFIDSKGVVFKVPMTNTLAQTFQLFGPQGSEKTVMKMYQILNPWLISQKITMTSLGLDDKYMWHLTLGNIDVILGDNHLEERLKKLAVVNRRIIDKFGQYIKSIDLRYKDGFSVHWKENINPNLSNKEE